MPGFDSNSLSSNYAFLDDCPESLVIEAVTLPVGTLTERVEFIVRWRKALLSGRLPEIGDWPSKVVEESVRIALMHLDIPRFCRDQEELTDLLIKDILHAIVRNVERLEFKVQEYYDELLKLEMECLEEELLRSGKAKVENRKLQLDPSDLDKLLEQAKLEVCRFPAQSDQQLEEDWRERAETWGRIADVFGDLGWILGRGLDLAMGVLQHVGWLELSKLSELINRLPQIRQIVEILGRMHDSSESESIATQILVPMIREETVEFDVETPSAPTEAKGIERSGDIGSMLPMEAVLLGHKKLRMLWHARRAERSLLAYRFEDVERIVRYAADYVEDGFREEEGQCLKKVRGPILIVIDTSGSMRGLPEIIAKALVFETVKIAFEEKRACFLYEFSGTHQVIKHELSLAHEGIGRLLDFLSYSFGGGTDIHVMSSVLDNLQESKWKDADVMLVSDGLWSASQKLIQRTKDANERGTRFHGIQIGSQRKTGLSDLCDPVHHFSSWAEIARITSKENLL